MFKCLLCGFRTKHSKSMVKHLMNEHRFRMDDVREKWKDVVSEYMTVVLKDEIDIILNGVKRI